MKFSFRFPATQASEATRAIRRRSLLLAVTLIAVLPLAWRGPSCGQDFDFHLQSWLDLARSWHEGVLYPWWAASPNFQAGEPRFVFYPPLSRVLGAALGCVLPWAWTPLAFTLLALLGAGFAFRAMAREWAGDDNAALAACLYVVNPYMLFVAYDRAAVAELLAAVWLPLLVLYGLRNKSSFLPLALTFAALWLTNAPAAVMGSYMLAIVVVVAVIRERRWALAGRAVAAVALGLSLAGFWLIPAIYEQRWVQIDQAVGPLMRVEDSFLFGFVRPAPGLSPDELFELNYHNQVLRTASWIVVALLAATFVAAGLARRRKSSVWLPLAVLSAVIAVLQFRWSAIAWHLTPKLAFLQFPWRWMLVLGMAFAFFLALALRPEPPTRRTIARRALALLLLAAAMAGVAAAHFWQPCDDEDNVAAQQATFLTSGFEGTDEYTLKGVDLDAEEGIANGDEAPPGPVTVVSSPHAGESQTAGTGQRQIAARVLIEYWRTERRAVRVTSPEAAYAVLRLIDYPAWAVTVNGVTVDRRQRSDGTMAIPISAGVNQIEVRWRMTPDEWTGVWLSFCALVVLLAWAASERRRTGETAPVQ